MDAVGNLSLRGVTRRHVRTTLFLVWVFLVSLGHPAAAQNDVFMPDADQRWASFLRQPRCTLVENVPIVPRTGGVPAGEAALSSVLGYYERRFPLIGPPQPKRIEALAAAPIPGMRALSDSDRLTLTRLLHDVDQRNFDAFLDMARRYPDVTDGVIRGRLIGQNHRGDVAVTLRKLASDGYQTVAIEPLQLRQGVPFGQNVDPLTAAVDAKQLALLTISGQQPMVLTSVGYASGGEILIVIDPTEAEPVPVPAESAYLTEADRRSQGPWAQRARELFARQTANEDAVTACRGSRPRGLRFLAAGRLLGRAEAHIIRSWSLDLVRVRAALGAP